MNSELQNINSPPIMEDRDRRRHKRVIFPNLISVIDKEQERLLLAYDISYGGLYFFSSKKYRIGENIKIKLLTFSDVYTLEGEIRWEKTNNDKIVGYGVRFNFLHGSDIEEITKILSEHI